MPVESKPVWKSVVLWVNIGTIFVVALGLILDNALDLGLPPQVTVWVTILLGVVNAVLRVLRTSQPLSIQGNVMAGRPPDPH